MTYEQFIDPVLRRERQMKVKSEAVWVAFLELDGLINVSRLAREYFGKSQSWFAQKLNGYTVCHKKRSFNAEEYARLAESFRDIARRLEDYATAIENADEAGNNDESE